MNTTYSNTIDEQKQDILREELEERITTFANTLIANGYGVVRENDTLIVEHPNGYTETLAFSKIRMEKELARAGIESMSKLSRNGASLSQQEISRAYFSQCANALAKQRIEFVQGYFAAVERKRREVKPSLQQQPQHGKLEQIAHHAEMQEHDSQER